MTITGLVGANPDHLDELAERLRSSADALESIRFTLRASLGRVEWPGPDGDQFRHDWDSHHGPVLARAVTMLREAARVARINAAEQRAASRDSTGLVSPSIAAIGVSIAEKVMEAFFGDAGPDTPDETFGWWSGLTPEQRTELIQREPERIGSMDGIPAADRDAANRILLARAAADGHPASIKLQERLAGRDDLYLLGFDPDGTGRAIIAVGNPDTADNIATFVPGMGTDLSDVGSLLSNMEVLRNLAQCKDPGASTSTIVWFDYEPPNDWNFKEALRDDRAAAASADLDRFQEGLRASHQGEPSQNTMIGHSYGGKVIGIADREQELPVDRIVFVGSPSVGVDRAAELSVGAENVYATVAPWDPLIRPVDLISVTPAEDGFGARTFKSDIELIVESHSSYFDPNSSSMENVAFITVGREDCVY